MATTWSVYEDTNMDAVGAGAWVDGDTLNIYGCTVTCDTDQSKGWKAVNIYGGTLLVKNTSTEAVNRFLMNIGTGIAGGSLPIKPSNALGTIKIEGAWIELGTGTGAPQDLTIPLAAYLPTLYVETGVGTGIFEPWVNATDCTDQEEVFRRGGSRCLTNDERGQMFIQDSLPEPYPINATVATPWDTTIHIGADSMATVPAGCRIRMSNLHFSDSTPVNYYSYPRIQIYHTRIYDYCHIDLTSGGVLDASIANFEFFNIKGAYASSFKLKDCGCTIPPTVSNCDAVDIDGFGIGMYPCRLCYGTGWGVSDYRYESPTWTLINGASIKRLRFFRHGPTNSTTANAYGFTISTSIGIKMENIGIYYLNQVDLNSSYNRAMFTLNNVNNSVVDDLKCFPGGIRLYRCTNVVVDGIKMSEGAFNETTCAPNGNYFGNYPRTVINPATGEAWEAGVPVYFKMRSIRYQFYIGDELITESVVVPSATPYVGRTLDDDRPHPWWFGVVPIVSGGAWVVKACFYGYTTPEYQTFSKIELYRSEAWGTLGTLIATVPGASTTSYNDSTSIVNGATYYYTLRYYYSSTEYTDSAQQIALIPNIVPTEANLGSVTNLLTYGYVSASQWTKSNATAANYACLAPQDPLSTGSGGGNSLYFATAAGSCYRSVTTVIGTTYTFSTFLRADYSSVDGVTPNSLDMKIGDTVLTITPSRKWKTYSVTFTATATSTTIGFYANANTLLGSGFKFYQMGGQVEASATAGVWVYAGSSTATARPCHDFTGVMAYSKEGARGIEIMPTFAASNVISPAWCEIYASTDPNFTPSKENMVYTSIVENFCPIQLDGTVNSTIKNLVKVGGGGCSASNSTGRCFMRLMNGSAGNTFMNFDYHFGCHGSYILGTEGSLNNDNLFYNMKFDWLKGRQGNSTTYSDNTNAGNTFENIFSNYGDVAFKVPHSNSIIKGLPGGLSRGRGGTNETIFDDNYGGVPHDYTAITSTMFCELNYTHTRGCLVLLTCPGVGDAIHYTILAGNPGFDGFGRLYIPEAGTSMEFRWPHRIRGVSGFFNAPMWSYGTLINRNGGVYTRQLEPAALKFEYAISLDNATWSEYKRMNQANLSAETLSASDGFFFKFKFTAMPCYEMDNTAAAFWNSNTAGKVLRASNGVTATVVESFFDEAGGRVLVWLSDITGDVPNTTNIFCDEYSTSTRVGLARGDSSGSAILPTSNSYMKHLIIPTTVDQSVLYSLAQPTLTLTGLKPGSEVRIFNKATGAEIAGAESSGTSFSAKYDYTADIDVYIVILALGYQWMQIDYTLTAEDASIPVQQVIDRVYENN